METADGYRIIALKVIKIPSHERFFSFHDLVQEVRDYLDAEASKMKCGSTSVEIERPTHLLDASKSL